LSKSFRNNLSELVSDARAKFNSAQLWGSEGDIQFSIEENKYKLRTIQLSFEDIAFNIPILNPELEMIIKKSLGLTETKLILCLVYSVTARILQSTVTGLCKQLLLNIEQIEKLEISAFELLSFVSKDFHTRMKSLLQNKDIVGYIRAKKESINKAFLHSFITSSSLSNVDNEDNVTHSNEMTYSALDSSVITNRFVSKFKNAKRSLPSLWGCNAEYSQYSQNLCADYNREWSSNAIISKSGDNILRALF